MTLHRTALEIVDTHLHLDEPAFDADRNDVIESAKRTGVTWFVNIAYIPERWASSRLLRDRYPEIEIALGVHPQHANIYDDTLDRTLRQAVTDLRPAAIGETGFDFFRSSPLPASQGHAFAAQLAVAAESALPIIIHQRSAADALMAALDRWHEDIPIVLHSFDGTDRLTAWSIERGCYVGIGGLATKPSSGALREQLKRIPPERLLLETDAPYLAPPGTASRRNVPENLPHIASLLARLWDLSQAELCSIAARNAARVFVRHSPREKVVTTRGSSV